MLRARLVGRNMLEIVLLDIWLVILYNEAVLLDIEDIEVTLIYCYVSSLLYFILLRK
jgi:hypothetical protein